MLDPETALRLNQEGVQAGREAGATEAEANAHINLANAYVQLDELARAREHLDQGERILELETHRHWLRWRFRIRLEIESANYWLMAHDTGQARTYAASALERATTAQAWKHAAAARRILGHAAFLEDRIRDAAVEYEAGMAILRRHPCPLEEWKLLLGAAGVAAAEDSPRGEALCDETQRVMSAMADTIGDAKLREAFLDRILHGRRSATVAGGRR
jgi:hypothetical protein